MTAPSPSLAGNHQATSDSPQPGSARRLQALSSIQEAQLLGLVCSTMFLVFTNSNMLAPLLLELATEFHTSLGTVGALAAASAIPWAILAPFMGVLSDRYGRRPVLTMGLVLLGCATVASAFSWDYSSLFVIRVIGGIGGATTGPNAMAAPADYFPPSRRGMAMGFVLGGISLATVIGVPLVALIAAQLGWRSAFITIGVLLLLLAAAVWALLPRSRLSAEQTGLLSGISGALGSRMTVTLLLANFLERCCFSAVTTYLASFLMQAYSIQLEEVAPVLSAIAIGTLAGSLFGGRLADRGKQRTQYAVLLLVTGVLAYPLFATMPGIVITCLIAAFFSVADSLARPAWLWMLTKVPAERRGATTGFAATTNQSGIIVGSAVGGVLIGFGGFTAIGLMGTAAAIASAVTCALTRVE